MQDAYLDRYNKTARHEWLNMHTFESVEHMQVLVTQWLYDNKRTNCCVEGSLINFYI